MKIAYHVMSAPAPLGLLFLASTERGLRYTEFMDRKSIKRVIAGREAENPGATWEASLFTLKPVVDQFEAYFCGALARFELPIDPVGSEFQIAAWNVLRAIPYGETRTYGEIARTIGQPRAARAVGLANHDNPIVIIVPCHRVIGADGSLTGYGGGLQRKRWLLRHEARFVTRSVVAPRHAAAAQVSRTAAAAPRQGARVVVAASTPARRVVELQAAPRGARVTAAPASTPASRVRETQAAPQSARVSAAVAPARRERVATIAQPRREAGRSTPPARGSGRRASPARTGARTTDKRRAR